MKRFLFLVALTAFSCGASAYDGNSLYEWSKANERVADGRSSGSDPVMSGMYMGFVIGVSNYMDGLGVICLPPGTKNQQALDVVRNYLQSHPERRTDDSLFIVHNSMTQSFPCAKK